MSTGVALTAAVSGYGCLGVTPVPARIRKAPLIRRGLNCKTGFDVILL